MMCITCSKLSYKVTNKKCIKCQGNVLNTLSVLCDLCSNRDKKCSACLKKIDNSATTKYFKGCGICGK